MRRSRLLRDDLRRLAVSSATAREMDRRTIEEYGIPGAVLMENAGSAAAEVALEMPAGGGGVLVFAGAGNNAGDGFVIARHLANVGLRVRVCTAVAAEKYRGDAALYLSVIRKMGLPIGQWSGGDVDITGVSLVVDALLGTGLSGELRPPFPEIIRFLNKSGVPILAVDVPSGLDSDTGRVVTAAVAADVTVTFGLPKMGLFAGNGPVHSGRIILADIGMPLDLYPEGKALYPL